MSRTGISAPRDSIRLAPLRDPGQSLRELIENRFYETVISWLLVAVLGATFAVTEWIRWLINAPYALFSMTVVAVAIAVYAAWQFRRAAEEARNWKQGLK